MTPPSNQATITVSAKDVPEVRRLLDALMAEHRALHAYLLAVLLHDDTAALRHYELTGAHDAVADVLAATGTPMTDRTAPADPREALARAIDAAFYGSDGKMIEVCRDNAEAILAALNDAGYVLAARQDEPSLAIGGVMGPLPPGLIVGESGAEALTPDEEAEVRRLAPQIATNFPWYAVQEDMLGGEGDSLLPRLLATLDRDRAARQDEPSPALRSALIAGLADALTKDWPGDTRHHASVGIADYLLKRPEVRRALAANPPQTREARLHHWDCRVPDDRPCPDVCVCWCHERFTADELLGDDNIFTEPPQTREAEGARYYDGGDDDAAKAQTGVLGMAAAAGDEAVRPGDGENDHGDRGVRGGDAADSARLTRQTPEAQRDAPADTIEAKIRALPSAMQSDPQERVVNRAAVIAAVEAAPADVERLAATLAKASDIAEWIATDIEDYQHGGREPDFAGWREAAIELCDLAAATQPPAAGTLDPDRCICGTDAALREGRTMILRTDVVCPKHDRPQPPAAGTEGGE